MNGQRTNLSDELQIIPGWAIGLAVVVFACMQFVFHVVVAHAHDAPPLVARIPLGIIAGGALACVVLAIGYVNRDAARRGMNVTAWTLIVIFVPNALGFIIYFLMRQPLKIECPRCHTPVDQTSNFCPKCAYSFRPTCPQCKRALLPGDVYCPNCGQSVKSA